MTDLFFGLMRKNAENLTSKLLKVTQVIQSGLTSRSSDFASGVFPELYVVSAFTVIISSGSNISIIIGGTEV
jgi:hypothetical protein